MENSEKKLQNDTYIVGMGCVTSNSRNIKELTLALRDGIRNFGYIHNTSFIGAEISLDGLKESLETYYTMLPNSITKKIKGCIHRATKEMLATIISVVEAYIEAQIVRKKMLGERIGIIIAGSNLTYKNKEEYIRKCMNTPEYLSPQYALNLFDTSYMSVISEIFDFNGEGIVVGGASASGNSAIIKAFQLIQLRAVDICFVIAPPSGMSSMEIQSFYNIGALGGKKYNSNPLKACRPFDTNHEGFILGEAAACIVLESKKSIYKRKIASSKQVLGGAIFLDGNRLSNPSLSGEMRAMEIAMANSGVNAKDISYINAHGTSSPLGDEIEAEAIKNVFRENLGHVWVNSTKGILGHCMNSAGVIEAIATIVQMDYKFIHMNANLEKPITDKILFTGKDHIDTKIKYALSNSFGFGGINTSIVLMNKQ